MLCCVRSGHDYRVLRVTSRGEAGLLTRPKAFLFIKEVADEIRKAGRHGILLSNLIEDIFSLLFADDVALVSHTPVGLQNHLNVLARASAKIGLQVNLNKTKQVVFRKGGHIAAHEKWFIHGQRLEAVNSYISGPLNH